MLPMPSKIFGVGGGGLAYVPRYIRLCITITYDRENIWARLFKTNHIVS